MPAGRGKSMLRCSIPDGLHTRLVEEATARQVDLGAIVEGRLEQSFDGDQRAASLVQTRLDVLVQQQVAMLQLLEELVKAMTGREGEETRPADDVVPIATYAQMYQDHQVPVSREATNRPEPETAKGWKRWPFSSGSNG